MQVLFKDRYPPTATVILCTYNHTSFLSIFHAECLCSYAYFFFCSGKCDRGVHCPFLHDKGAVPVCKFFLQGRCTKTAQECTFRHEASTCPKFLKGSCTDKHCLYPHIYNTNEGEATTPRTPPALPLSPASQLQQHSTPPALQQQQRLQSSPQVCSTGLQRETTSSSASPEEEKDNGRRQRRLQHGGENKRKRSSSRDLTPAVSRHKKRRRTDHDVLFLFDDDDNYEIAQEGDDPAQKDDGVSITPSFVKSEIKTWFTFVVPLLVS